MRASIALKLLPACCALLLAPASRAFTSVGCAADDPGTRVMEVGPISEATMSAAVCEGICLALDPTYTHFGTEYGNECFCTSELGTTTESSDCTMDCANTEGEICGGFNAISVYEIDSRTPAPTPAPGTLVPGTGENFVYAGCAVDSQNPRIMEVGPFTDVPMSAEICYAYCDNLDPWFTHFGTQYSSQCFCSINLGTTTESSDCTMECANTAGEACGGSYTMSVYEINDPGYPTPAPTPAPMTIIGDGYIGCYADDQNNRVMPVGPISETTMSAEVCSATCIALSSTYTHYGTQYSSECFCTDDVEDLTDSSACTMPCANNPDEICGGPEALSVYEIDAEPIAADYVSIGCRTDVGDDRIMGDAFESFLDDMTTEECYRLCSDYFGPFTHFGTQYGIQCFCVVDPDLESINKHSDELLPASEHCLMPCSGDADQTCGGSYEMNVYEVYTEPADDYTTLGCFSDPRDGDRVMEVMITAATPMSTEICYNLCLAEGYAFFGTQYSNECWCSTQLYATVADDSLCDMECADNSPEICGGFDAISAYFIP
ncbi:unnamed protein product [Pylaiella littoralis]